MGFLTRFRQTVPDRDEIAVFWLGQAGFLIRTSSGHTIAIDPYFSDYVMHSIPEAGIGFKRLSPPPCEAGDIPFDALLISHEHGDHFDQESIGTLMENGFPHFLDPLTGDGTFMGGSWCRTVFTILARMVSEGEG